MIEVSFEHWCYTFTEEMLIKYGSRYFPRKDAGAEYARHVYQHAELVSARQLDFSENQIRSGNEAFAEAAVADLEVWDEWRSGTRYFPYPGRYTKLDIVRQDDKTSSPSSVGVIGEILAGFFAQAGVSPWILVRVVRRWPDFIFADRNGTYSFVESKAFTSKPESQDGLRSRILDALLVEGTADAAQQLNSDPFGRVWNAFTRICSITPMRLEVTFVEFGAPDSRRSSQPLRTTPAAVVEGLAERAVNQAFAKLDFEGNDALFPQSVQPYKQLAPGLIKGAREEIAPLVREIDPESRLPIDRTRIEQAVDDLISKIFSPRRKRTDPKNRSGRRLIDAKREGVQGKLSRIRLSGTDVIYIADLPLDNVFAIRRTWTPDWSRATSPLGRTDGAELWRCGGAVICIGGDKLEGLDIHSVRLS